MQAVKKPAIRYVIRTATIITGLAAEFFADNSLFDSINQTFKSLQNQLCR